MKTRRCALLAMGLSASIVQAQIWLGTPTNTANSWTTVGVNAQLFPALINQGPRGGLLNANMTAANFQSSNNNCSIIGWTPGLNSAQRIFGVGGYAGTSGAVAATQEGAEGVRGQAYNTNTTIGVQGLARMDAALTGTGGLFIGVSGWGSTNQSRSTGTLVGVAGIAGPQDAISSGTWGTGLGGDFTCGSIGTLFTTAYGVRAVSRGVTTTYGVSGSALTGTTRYGVYGTAAAQANSWAGYFVGNGFLSTPAWTYSDRGAKINVEPIGSALETLSRLSPKTYRFNTSLHPSMNLPESRQYGLISQEVAEVLPDLTMDVHHPDQFDSEGKVTEKGFDFKAMNYTGLIPILIAGIQEQQAIIDDKQTQIDALTARLDRMEATMNGEGKRGSTAPAINKAELFQNTPNPFNENTVIRYSLPENCGKCAIDVVDANGKLVKTFANLGAGNGQLLITGGSLTAGSYTYTLIVNGERSDSKTMVITR